MKTHQLPEMQQQRPLPPSHYPHRSAGMREDFPSLIPDAVLPEQFYGPPRRGARTHWHTALMLAVLTDAIECYLQRWCAMQGQRSQRLAQEAQAWLFSDDERWPFAFVNVCAALGLDPAYVRRGLPRQRQFRSTNVDHKLHPVASARRLPRCTV